MNACVRGSSTLARSCQDKADICEFMRVASKTGRRAGADDLTRLAPDVPEAMRQVAGEVVGLSCRKDARDARQSELDATLHHDAGLFATMCEHLVARLRARRISFV